MFKKTLILGMVLGFATLCFAKGTETEAIGTQAIEPKLIMEYKFDEPVVDVIYDSATMTVKEARALGAKGLEKKKEGEKIKVSIPKVAFIPKEISFRKEEQEIKEIRFYDKKGSVSKRIEIGKEKPEWVITSPNKKYILVSRSPDEFSPDSQGGTLYKMDGSLIWRKDEGPFPVAVSDEGFVVAGELGWEAYAPRDFIFYNPVGNEIGKIKNPYGDKTDIGVGYAQFSRSGEYVLVGYCCFSKTTMILATKEGNVLWQKEIDYQSYIPTRESDFVEEVGIIGVGTQEKPSWGVYAFFIDWKGNLKWTVPLGIGGEINVRLSQKNKKGYIASTEGYVWCIELERGRLLWKHKEEWLPNSTLKSWPDNIPCFYEMEVAEKYVYIIYIIGKYHSSVVYIFNPENGNLIQKTEYPNKRITFISQDNNLFLLDIDAKKLLFFETKEINK